MSEGRLHKGRHIVVTGGANGMGLTSCRRLAAAGGNLAICDLNAEGGKKLLDELKQQYPDQIFFFKVVDVTDLEAMEAFVNEAKEALGPIHSLFSCAGIGVPGPRLHEMDMKSFRKTIDVNQYGTIYINQLVLRAMMEQNAAGVEKPKGGYTILNMGSKGSVDGLPGAPAYTAAKHAVLGLSRVIAKDYAADGIRCNVLCPGLIMTDLVRGLIASGNPELSEEHMMARCYSKRFGTVEEMANIVHFLLGPESAYMTGQAIEADGSWQP